jgi:hypothetical protein
LINLFDSLFLLLNVPMNHPFVTTRSLHIVASGPKILTRGNLTNSSF